MTDKQKRVLELLRSANIRCDMWHVPSDMSHETCDMRQNPCDMWHMTHDTWHMTHDTWHMIHDIWHVTFDMWHLTCEIWHGATGCFRFFCYCILILFFTIMNNVLSKFLHQKLCSSLPRQKFFVCVYLVA